MTKGLLFNKVDGGYIKISENVLIAIESFKQSEKNSKEAGGVLVGRFIENSRDVVIDYISTPMKGDIRRRTFFKRRKNEHQEFVNKFWNDSNGAFNYLGEWHTHPERVPTPSCIDINEWKRIMKEADYDYECLFFCIVGTEMVEMWQGFRGSKELIHLKPEK